MKPTPIRHSAVWLFAALALAGAVHSQESSLTRQRTVTVDGKSYVLTSKLKSILVGDFFYNFDHHSGLAPQNMIATLNRLAATEGWTVEVTTDGNAVTAEKLKGHQVFFADYISSWAAAGKFPAANRAAMQDFVENGGGLFLMHSSGDSHMDGGWPWFLKDVQPGSSTGFENRYIGVSAPVFVPPESKSHPILEGISFAGSDTVLFPAGDWPVYTKPIAQVKPQAVILLKMDGIWISLWILRASPSIQTMGWESSSIDPAVTG